MESNNTKYIRVHDFYFDGYYGDTWSPNAREADLDESVDYFTIGKRGTTKYRYIKTTMMGYKLLADCAGVSERYVDYSTMITVHYKTK